MKQGILLLTNVTLSIVIREDKSERAYLQNPKKYPATFTYPLTQKPGDNCAATLISKKHAITATHCFGEDDPKPPFQVKIGGRKHVVSKLIKNPCYSFANDGGPVGADIAILVLRRASRAKPEPMYRSNDAVGKTITIIGWGDSTTAGGDAPDDGEGSGKFRVG
jgi:hypothetical protein